PDGVALSRFACAAAQLFRTGRTGARQSGSDRKSILPDGTRRILVTDGGSRDGGNSDRKSGGYHRCLFNYGRGHSARIAATAHDPAHVRDTFWSNLYSARQFYFVIRRAPARGPLPDFECARRRVRDRGYDDDGGGRNSRLHRDLEIVAVETMG